eukprot:TRINITY_DN19837_c0_g2_i1.p1 TRINITY_DN19837_c0_g2~~TRINITY_DN19837_c0_g2_i1.p1  ORF type:complete len:303 (+),score=68.39 TRINITY_DN19837_c0_g2_i1:394-1302(+)
MVRDLEERNRQLEAKVNSQENEIRQLRSTVEQDHEKIAEIGSTSPRVMWQQSLNDKGAMLQEWEEALQEKQSLMEDRENNLREMEASLRVKDRSLRDLATREALLSQREQFLSNLQHREVELNQRSAELDSRAAALSEGERGLREEEQRLSLNWKELEQLKEIVRRNPALRHHELSQQEMVFNREMKEREDSLHEKAMELAAWEKRLTASGTHHHHHLTPTASTSVTPTQRNRSLSRDRDRPTSYGSPPSDGIKLHVIQRTPTGTQKLHSYLNHAYEEDFSTPRTFSPSPSQARTPSWSLTK